MDCVLPGESLPALSRYLMKEFLKAITELSIVVILALFVTFGAENLVKGPVVLLTEGLHNLRLEGLLTLIAITHGKTVRHHAGGLSLLTDYSSYDDLSLTANQMSHGICDSEIRSCRNIRVP